MSLCLHFYIPRHFTSVLLTLCLSFIHLYHALNVKDLFGLKYCLMFNCVLLFPFQTSSQPLSPRPISPSPLSPLAPGSGVDFSTPPQFTSLLDNSAARHRMSLKPKNQRASAKNKRVITTVSIFHGPF